MDINQIKQLQSLDLESFEIRGAKAGVGNASTTGPVYDSGSYILPTSKYSATGNFIPGSPSITGIVFSAPYSGYDCTILKDNDTITVGSSSFTIKSIDSVNSVTVTMVTGLSGSQVMTLHLSQREYLVEPDILTNILTGNATFTQGSPIVIGNSTHWKSKLVSGDFIQHDGFQEYFEILSVDSNTQLTLTSTYIGDSTYGAYTAKKWTIGSTEIEYTKNNFTYDKNSARWKSDSTTGSGLSTSIYPTPLADGINLSFTHTISPGAPDLMDSATVLMKTFAQSTQTDAFQFSLPVVPNPESSMDLYINGIPAVRNTDYVINYNQSPIYLPPPPAPQVANIMPLASATNIEISRSSSENGQIHFVDAGGNPVSGVMPGTELIKIDSTQQVPYRDYMINPYAGTAEIIHGTVNEELVKYVAVNKSNLIDYGIKVYMDGIPQAISNPPQDSDDVRIAQSGRLRIKGKDHPGPGEEYEIHYQVPGGPVSNEKETVLINSQGNKYVQTSLYPLQNDTVLVTKNGFFLDEWIDYRVSYPTGRITFLTSTDTTDQVAATYTPLSLQVNSMTFEDSTSFCTVYDSRLSILDSTAFKFSITNSALQTENINVLRIYNETRNKEYNLTNITKLGYTITLEKNATNIAIGLDTYDNIISDYKFASEVTEYQPIILNKITAPAGSYSMYFSGMDVTSDFPSFSVVRLSQPDGALPFYFLVASSVYDGEGTLVTFWSPIQEDMSNPFIAVTDNIVTFNSVPYRANTIVSGSSDLFFQGVRIRNLFRVGTLLQIGADIYQVQNAGYDDIRLGTAVRIGGTFLKDYITPTIYASDQPVYFEGSTELSPFMNIVDTLSQPGIILSGNVNMTTLTDATSLSVVSDSSTYQFFYADHTTCGLMASYIQASVPDLDATTYVSQWDSTKIISGQSLTIANDFPATITVQTTLRLDGTDTTNFSVSTQGGITLEEGLVKGQRYNLDYMGRRYLDDQTVVYSANYFTMLSKGSKVQASFRFDNVDQFYIQVMSQRDFLENVTIPRMKEEALQLNGNPGQGGSVPDDEAQGNDQGGLANDEYRRKDAEIECDVFKQIYDWFSDRLSAFGNEMYSAIGPKLFNNDGTFSLTEQQGATLATSRIFPYPDYTNFEPFRVNPLTGEYYSYGALFTQGLNIVTNIGSSFGYPSYWTTQLKSNDFIRKFDSTKMYKIQSVDSDTQVTLNTNFAERSTATDTRFGASSGYPIYDDDGNLGAKIVGSRSDNFGLISGDIFDYSIDGSSYTYYSFAIPTDPFMALLFPPDNLNADSVAKMISNPTKGLIAKAEWVFDSNTTYGYKTVIVLRTVPPYTGIKLGTGTAISKLGFQINDEVYGNLDPLKSNPEIVLIPIEIGYLADEFPNINYLISAGSTDKLARVNPINIPYVTPIYLDAYNEFVTIASEIPKINQEVISTEHIIQEPGRPAYAGTYIAHTNAVAMYNDTWAAQIYNLSLITNWQGHDSSTNWVLDLLPNNRYVRGKNTVSGIGVPTSSGTNIVNINGETTFIIDSASDNDRRILLNALIDGTVYQPSIVYENNLLPVSGTWTGGDPSVGNVYTLNNTMTFNFNHSTPVFTILADGSTISNRNYLVDKTSMNLSWEQDTTTYYQSFPYSTYTTIGSMKTGINTVSGFDATGNISLDSSSSESFLLSSGVIVTDATIYPALRSCYVTWSSISDQMLNDRATFVVNRSTVLNNRNLYLINTRQSQIVSNVIDEGILRDSSGNPGDLYTWANNRWNRRQGCNAKLVQIENQIKSNKSALSVSQTVAF